MFRPFSDEVRDLTRDIVRLREKLSADRFQDSPTWVRASPVERVDWLFKEVEQLRAHRDDLMLQNAELAKRATHATKDCLRAQQEVEAMKRQEPVSKVHVHKTGGNAGITWSARPLNDYDSLPALPDGSLLYLAPGAQTAPSVPAPIEGAKYMSNDWYYAEGWNDCRHAMLDAQAAPSAPDDNAAFEAWFRSEQGTPYDGMRSFARDCGPAVGDPRSVRERVFLCTDCAAQMDYLVSERTDEE